MNSSEMHLGHIAIPIACKEDIQNFFAGILGFYEKYSFNIDQMTATAIFGIESELEITLVENNGIRLELFHLNDTFRPGIAHTCLLVADPEDVCRKAAISGYPVTRVSRTSGMVAFIADKTGNRFEIKQSRLS